MPKFYGQNKKRIDPRYFLEETTDRKLSPEEKQKLMARAGVILSKAGADGPVVAIDKGIITREEYAMLQQIRKVLGFGVQSHSDVDPDRAEFGPTGQHGLGPGYKPGPS